MLAFEPITVLQRHWLQEIGVDRSLLMRLPMQEPLSAAPVTGQEPEKGALSKSVAPASTESAKQARDEALAMLLPQRTRSALRPVNEVMQSARPRVNLHVLANDLSGLDEQIKECDLCPLHEGRALTVFGRGQEQSPDWLVVGEAPSASDDRSGLPFDGQAGELLQAMLKAVLPHASFYFTHLVKCRPLGNRPPQADELEACRRYLDKQIECLVPKRILAVGQLAAEVFAQQERALDTQRGKTLAYCTADGRTLPLVLSHHPAALLLRPQHKAQAWRDLLQMRTLQEASMH